MKLPKIPKGAPRTQVTKYVQFRGVDMSNDPSQIDNKRSSFAPNLISDTGGNPEKRLGWRTLHELGGKINGLFYTVIEDATYYVAHAGTKLYAWDEAQGQSPQLMREGLADHRSTGWSMGERFWLLTGSEYLVMGMFESPADAGESTEGDAKDTVLQVKLVSEIAYVPTTIIGRAPNGGGTVYEEVNLVGKQRVNSFLADGAASVYQLDSQGVTSVDKVVVGEKEKAETTDYTVDLETGKVTFVTAPKKPENDGGVAGQDNVKITFTKEVAGYEERIQGCCVHALYGVGSNDRVFVTGNEQMKSYDWASFLRDPTYFPDLGYANVGTEGTRIMGYCRVGEYLAIVKEDNQLDSTIFLRSAELSSEGKSLFRLKQGAAGVGAVSRYCFANLLDDPLFLSRTGVYAITSNAVTYDRTVKNRSYYVDAQLTKEENLEQAVAVEWNGYYIVAINGRCYILDGKQNKSYRNQYASDYVYECYHWEHVPAVSFMEHAGDLYFGTLDGRICRFNNDMARMNRYSDDGEAIVCYWATKADDDGDFTMRKTLVKKGCGVMIKPYLRSSAKVTIRTDADFGREIAYRTMDIFDWNELDFTRFSFTTNDAPQVIAFNTKVKKYITCQIIVKNDGVDEGFGIYGVIKRYQVVKPVK